MGHHDTIRRSGILTFFAPKNKFFRFSTRLAPWRYLKKVLIRVEWSSYVSEHTIILSRNQRYIVHFKWHFNSKLSIILTKVADALQRPNIMKSFMPSGIMNTVFLRLFVYFYLLVPREEVYRRKSLGNFQTI